MADVFTAVKRSQVMSRIRGRGNKATELALIRLFRAHHITGWRRHQRIFGRPDFILRGARIAIFVDGCFWPGCPQHSTTPANNAAFWRAKLRANVARDRLVNRTLRASDWSVIRVWEHELTRKGQSRTPGFPFSGCRGKLAGMPRSAKPVRKCHACLLNLGDRCWHYASPRDQWRAKRRCPGHDHEELHAQFRLWLKRPQVKTRKELRREAFGGRTRATVYGGRQPKRGNRH